MACSERDVPALAGNKLKNELGARLKHSCQLLASCWIQPGGWSITTNLSHAEFTDSFENSVSIPQSGFYVNKHFFCLFIEVALLIGICLLQSHKTQWWRPWQLSKPIDACKHWIHFSFSWPGKAQPVKYFILLNCLVFWWWTCARMQIICCNILCIKCLLCKICSWNFVNGIFGLWISKSIPYRMMKIDNIWKLVTRREIAKFPNPFGVVHL